MVFADSISHRRAPRASTQDDENSHRRHDWTIKRCPVAFLTSDIARWNITEAMLEPRPSVDPSIIRQPLNSSPCVFVMDWSVWVLFLKKNVDVFRFSFIPLRLWTVNLWLGTKTREFGALASNCPHHARDKMTSKGPRKKIILKG